MKTALSQKSKSILSNEEIMHAQSKLMFEQQWDENNGGWWIGPQRSMHPEIDPASKRLKAYQTKNMKDKLQTEVQ